MLAIPGLRAPLVTYRLTEGDLSRLARGMIHLGEVLLAAGATELYPSVTGGPLVRRVDELVQWWDAVARSRANVMTVHMTSSVGIGEARDQTGADSFGRVWGYENLRVNDASLRTGRARREPAGHDHDHRLPQLRTSSLADVVNGGKASSGCELVSVADG